MPSLEWEEGWKLYQKGGHDISSRHKSSEARKLGHVSWVAIVIVWLCSSWAEDGSEKPVGALLSLRCQ